MSILDMISNLKEDSVALMQTTVRLPRGIDTAISKFCDDSGIKKGMLLRRMIEDRWEIIQAELTVDGDEE